MPKLKVYEYGNCDTCRKALKFLAQREVEFERIPIVEHPPTAAELRTVARAVGDFRKLFNTSGQVYRELKLGARLKTLTEDEALELLTANGKLVKRPLVIGKTAAGAAVALVGFNEPLWTSALTGRR